MKYTTIIIIIVVTLFTLLVIGMGATKYMNSSDSKAVQDELCLEQEEEVSVAPLPGAAMVSSGEMGQQFNCNIATCRVWQHCPRGCTTCDRGRCAP